MTRPKKGILSRLLAWVKYPYRMTRRCSCGQESSGVCTSRFQLYGAGVLAQDSSKLLACGKVKQQMQQMQPVKWPKDISTQEIADGFASLRMHSPAQNKTVVVPRELLERLTDNAEQLLSSDDELPGLCADRVSRLKKDLRRVKSLL